MIGQQVKNFKLGSLKKTKVTASSGLILIMSFAKEIGLAAELKKRLSHIKKRKKRSPAIEEEVAESVHFVGPEKGGKAYRFVVVRRKNNQLALFPEYQYTYRIYFTNTDWDKHKVVHFYRQRGDAENVIKEEKEGFAVENILSEDFLANAAIFQMQLLAYNLVQYFKYTNLKKSWWNLRFL